MNALLRPSAKFDVQALVQAIKDNGTHDCFHPALNPIQWDVLATYLQPMAVENKHVLIHQGAQDRTLYIVESGSLTVHFEDAKGRVRLAIVLPGSAVGEGAFFTRLPRGATVHAASACKIWGLTPIRFTELSNRNPAVALEVALALGTLVSHRLINKPKRIAFT